MSEWEGLLSDSKTEVVTLLAGLVLLTSNVCSGLVLLTSNVCSGLVLLTSNVDFQGYCTSALYCTLAGCIYRCGPDLKITMST